MAMTQQVTALTVDMMLIHVALAIMVTPETEAAMAEIIVRIVIMRMVFLWLFIVPPGGKAKAPQYAAL